MGELEKEIDSIVEKYWLPRKECIKELATFIRERESKDSLSSEQSDTLQEALERLENETNGLTILELHYNPYSKEWMFKLPHDSQYYGIFGQGKTPLEAVQKALEKIEEEK